MGLQGARRRLLTVEVLENFYEQMHDAIGQGIDLSEWLDQDTDRKRIFRTKAWADYYKARQNSKLGNAPPDTKGESSPHALLAIPRALLQSTIWRNLSPGARDLYYYLLTRSNTRSFKDVYPGAETIENDLNIDRRTRWNYEAQLTSAKILKIYQPGERDLNGDKHRSRRFAFTITRYLNADRRAYNEKKGREVYAPLRDMHSLWHEVERVSARAGYDAQQIQDRAAASRLILDQVAKRMKITGIDERGRVRVSIFSRLYPTAIAESQLPDNVLLFPEPDNEDVIINSKETWQGIENKLYKALADAGAKRSMQGLIDLMQAIEDKNTAKDSRTA